MSQRDWQTDKPLVLDTNTALSGLIGGITRKLILNLDRELRYPEPSFEEIERNRGIIQERANVTATTVDDLIDRLFKNITLVPEATVVRTLDTAATTTSPHPDANRTRTFAERDGDDVVFLATALAVNGAIWSDDGVFKHQDHVAWYRTEEIIEHARVD